MFDIQEELKKLPKSPGVYIMKDSRGEIIYVGKAILLSNRVRQYFQSPKSQPPKVKALVKHIKEFEYIIVDNEIEALILEQNLIKKHQPKYNILLRDDKQYPYIKITYKERFPRILKTRKVIKDGSKYFGPYPNVSAVNETIELIKEIYPIRKCNRKVDKDGTISRPCLHYHISNCFGPCKGFKFENEYMENIKEIDRFLSGKDNKIIEDMKEKMVKASEELEFEKAASFRDKLEALEIIQEKQKIESDDRIDQDVIAMARGIEEVYIQIFFIRNGKIIGREYFIIDDNFNESKQEILSSFIKQYYLGASYIPKEIIIETEIEDLEAIENWLSDKRGYKVTIHVPQRGEKVRLIEMVKVNAHNMLKRNSENLLKKQNNEKKGVEELQSILNLDKYPMRIESFDISNIQGVDSVGSMIVFENGLSKKSDYRRFKINTINKPDDYGSMQEILQRRFIRGIKEKESINDNNLDIKGFSIFPDLILMDGGKGQVNIAILVLDSLGLEIPVAGLVKDENHQTRGIIYENKEINLDYDTNAFRLIYNIQEEAHRFAISYHRSLRSKKLYKSELDDIGGIGPKRKQELFRHFKTIDNIKNAEIDELLEVKSMNKKVANELYDYFRKKEN